MSNPKKPRIMQKYRPLYEERWPGTIKASRTGDEFAFCCTCNNDIRISHGGSNDIEKHFLTQKHKSAAANKASTKSMTGFLKKKDDSDAVTNAECLFVKFLVEHNIPLSAADHAGPLLRKMFPDSAICQQYSCGRTKATSISNYFGEDISQQLALNLKSEPFSVSTDGSNDSGSETLYPIVIRYYDKQVGMVLSELLKIAVCNSNSTGKNIFNLLNDELNEKGLSWENCVSFGCDNANVMVGQHKGVAAFVLKKNLSVQIQGCPCHLLHIAAKNASKQLSVDVELALIDIYHYFDKSAKRQQEFISMLEATGTAVRKILKHGPTRWLSLLNCVERLIEQWDALHLFFNEEHHSKSNVRHQRITTFFSNPLSKLFCTFLSKTLPLFVQANAFLQSEEPLLHLMQDKMLDILTTLSVRFIKPKKLAGNLFHLDFFNKDIHKHREDVVIGHDTRSHLELLKKEEKISNSKETIFFNDVRKFYATDAAYISKKLPVESDLLAHTGVLMPHQRLESSFSSLRMFMTKLPAIKPKDSSMDAIEEEFLLYQQDTLNKEILNCERIDKTWAAISELKNVEGKLKYANLARVMLGILVIPHSNAECERIFSMVKKCRTEFRASMSASVLSNSIIQKVHMTSRDQTCHQVRFTSNQLSNAKSACYRHLKQ